MVCRQPKGPAGAGGASAADGAPPHLPGQQQQAGRPAPHHLRQLRPQGRQGELAAAPLHDEHIAATCISFVSTLCDDHITTIVCVSCVSSGCISAPGSAASNI